MRPDAIPVRALASRAEVPARLVQALFGTELSGGERLGVARLGETRLRLPVVVGDRLRLRLDTLDADRLGDVSASGARLVGPVGSAAAPTPEAVVSVLVLPEGLRGAWNVPDRATLGLGALAAEVTVETGTSAELRAERGLWVAAGRPATARWLSGVVLTPDVMATPAATDRAIEIEGRVVTETDVRQARLRRRRIALRAEQIVTPGARDMAREWDIFLDG